MTAKISENNITAKQRAMLFRLCAELGIDDDLRRETAAAYNRAGTPSFNALTRAEARRFIDDLQKKLRPAGTYERLSGAQTWLIRRLAGELAISVERLNGFIARQTDGRKRHVADLGRAEAIKIIDGLKAVRDRGGFQDRA